LFVVVGLLFVVILGHDSHINIKTKNFKSVALLK